MGQTRGLKKTIAAYLRFSFESLRFLEKNLLVAIIPILGGFFIVHWKCQYGVDLTDEAYSIIPGWKLFSLGERPFVYEVYNAPRHFDFLNYILLSPWIPYSVLWIRVSAAIAYSAFLLGFTCLCFRGNFGLSAGIVYLACLTLDTVLTSEWSYNSWARNMLILHQSFLMIAFIGKAGSKLAFPLAGASMGLAVIAYNPLLIPFIITFIAIVVLDPRSKGSERKDKMTSIRVRCISTIVSPRTIAYCAGALAVMTPDVIYTLSPGVRTDWLYAVASLKSLNDYASVASYGKLWGLIHWVIKTPEFWFTLIVGLVVSRPKVWPCWMGRILHQPFAHSPILRARASSCFFWIVLTILILHISIRSPLLSNGEETFRTYAAMALAGALLVFLHSWVTQNYCKLILMITGVTCVFTMGMASGNEKGATVWAIPCLILPFMGFMTKEFRDSENNSISRKGLAHVLLLALGILLCKGALLRQLTRTYFDISPKQATTTVEIPPLQGLRTSARRAFLVEKLGESVKMGQYILAYPFVPGVFYFYHIRSAVNTLTVQFAPPLKSRIESLKWMAKFQRFPEFIVRLKIHPWSWGIGNSNARLSPEDPYNLFADCVTKKILLDLPEFEVIETDFGRMHSCLSNAYRSPEN